MVISFGRNSKHVRKTGQKNVDANIPKSGIIARRMIQAPRVIVPKQRLAVLLQDPMRWYGCSSTFEACSRNVFYAAHICFPPTLFSQQQEHSPHPCIILFFTCWYSTIRLPLLGNYPDISGILGLLSFSGYSGSGNGSWIIVLVLSFPCCDMPLHASLSFSLSM